MSPAADRLSRIKSIAEELRTLELDATETLTFLAHVGLSDAQILAALTDLAGDVDLADTQILTGLAGLSTKIDDGVAEILAAILGPPSPPAVSATLTVVNNQGEPEPMPSTITVDTVGEAADLQFVDDKGDTDAAPPTGADGNPAVIAFVSSDPTVFTVDPESGAITVVGEGTADLSVTIDDDTGAPILEADGTTPFAPAPVSLTVTAGAAVGARLSVNP